MFIDEIEPTKMRGSSFTGPQKEFKIVFSKVNPFFCHTGEVQLLDICKVRHLTQSLQRFHISDSRPNVREFRPDIRSGPVCSGLYGESGLCRNWGTHKMLACLFLSLFTNLKAHPYMVCLDGWLVVFEQQDSTLSQDWRSTAVSTKRVRSYFRI